MNTSDRLKNLSEGWEAVSLSQKSNTANPAQIRNTRALEVLKIREAGASRSDVASALGLTTERVRQMENLGRRIARRSQVQR